jgi:TolB-like protein/DNA-binding winged helix-turn-helix (wHTH) protein
MREIRQFGLYRLDVAGRQLERSDGTDVALGAKAFDALVFLVEHAGEPVSRKTLMDAVWPDTVVEENNLTQAISALRRALGDGYIATLPGRGYQFVAEVRSASNGAAAEPQGPAAREPVDVAAAARRRRWVGPAVAALSVATLLVAAGWAWMTSRVEGNPARSESAIRSIAVLPMRLVSDDPEPHAHFADGLSIELRDRLDRLEGLLVSADGSSRAFKDKDADPRTIGEALNVQAVLEGTFRISANRLRINVSLVEVADGHTLWISPTYEGELKDAFAIQDRIAHAVVGELSLALGIESPGWAYGGTENPIAFNHYVTGLCHYVCLSCPLDVS